VYAAETERVYECDLVLLAMGFVGPEKSVLTELSLAQDSRGNIDTSNVKYLTSVPRVYTAGGMCCTLFKLNKVEWLHSLGEVEISLVVTESFLGNLSKNVENWSLFP